MPILQPIVNANIIPQQGLTGVAGQRILMVGQMGPAGTATDEEIVRVTNPEQAISLFGAGHLLEMLKGAFSVLKNASGIELHAYPIADDGANTAAEGKIEFTGTATSAGILDIYVASKNYRKSINIAVGDTDIIIAAKVLSEFLLLDPIQNLPVTPTVGSPTRTDFIVKSKGAIGNNYYLEVSGEIPGITIATTPFAGGVGIETPVNLITEMSDNRYQTIIYQDQIDTVDILAELKTRWNMSNDVLDGVMFTSRVDSLVNLEALGAAFNERSAVIFGFPTYSTTGNGISKSGVGFISEIPDVAVAEFAAIEALRRTEGANIATYFTSPQVATKIGGGYTNSFPYHNTPLIRALPNVIGSGFSAAERLTLNDSGISFLGVNSSGTTVLIDTVVTTELTDDLGNPTDLFHFLNRVRQATYAREIRFNNFKTEYSQSVLAPTGSIAQTVAQVDVAAIATFDNTLWNILSASNIYAGTQADYEASRTINIDNITGTAVITATPEFMGQFRILNDTLIFSL